jgi:hypothetical protein
LGSGYVFIGFPLKRFFGAFSDMGSCDTLEDKTLRVPTFYSPPDEDEGVAIILSICVAIVLGGIHCIAWSFHFATFPERRAWRVSAVLVSALPIAIPAIFVLPGKSEVYKGILGIVMILMLCLYIIARIILLVLPFMALRALLPGAYVQLDWVSFLPHI